MKANLISYTIIKLILGQQRDYPRAVLGFVWDTRYVTLRSFVLLPAYCGTANEDQDNPPSEYLFS
jgi:hypothetical protein